MLVKEAPGDLFAILISFGTTLNTYLFPHIIYRDQCNNIIQTFNHANNSPISSSQKYLYLNELAKFFFIIEL